MKTRKEYGPSDSAKMLAGLREAAEQVQREEFNKIVAPESQRSTGKRCSVIHKNKKTERSMILKTFKYSFRLLKSAG
jgi:hypothetical protein